MILNLSFQIIAIELLDKRGYLTISLSLAKEGKILLRRPEGIKEWFQALKVNHYFNDLIFKRRLHLKKPDPNPKNKKIAAFYNIR